MRLSALRPALPTIRRFASARSGFAATEFALIAPIMVFLFFAVTEGSDALAAGRRITLAANTLADLVAQESQVTNADLNGLFTGMELIAGASDATTSFTIISVVYDEDDDRVEVGWSYDDQGTSPYAQGSAYTGLSDATLLDDASSLIVVEAELNYDSQLSKYLIDTIDMERRATRWPRRALQVEYCGASC